MLSLETSARLLGGLLLCVVPACAPPSGGDLGGASALSGGTPQITLRTALRGRYLTAEGGGNGALTANRPTPSTWEIFTLVDLSGGDLEDGDEVHLAASDGRFVCAEGGGGGAVNATRPTASAWETFTIEKRGGSPGSTIQAGDVVTLMTRDTFTYLSAAEGGGGGLDATAIDPNAWTRFQIGDATGVGVGSPYALTLDEEFDGPSRAIDNEIWSYEKGAGGWGNFELESYTDRADNVYIDGAGSLEISARAEAYQGAKYTSGRITTQHKLTQAYGRIEARIRMPSGVGIWPAFWALGDDISAGWPGCGELDIMETAKDFSTNHGSAHGPGYSGGGALTGTVKLAHGSLADDFHVYSIEWRPDEIRWYLDGQVYETRTPADLPTGKTWVYDHPFFLLLNVAVGGTWPGSPNSHTIFPSTMYVDWVRVYQTP